MAHVGAKGATVAAMTHHTALALTSSLCGGPLGGCCPDMTITEHGVKLTEHGHTIVLSDAQLAALADRVAHARAALATAAWLDEDEPPTAKERTGALAKDRA